MFEFRFDDEFELLFEFLFDEEFDDEFEFLLDDEFDEEFEFLFDDEFEEEFELLLEFRLDEEFDEEFPVMWRRPLSAVAAAGASSALTGMAAWALPADRAASAAPVRVEMVMDLKDMSVSAAFLKKTA